MNNLYSLFKKITSNWVKYSKYEFRQIKDGIEYLTPAPKATPSIYNSLKKADTMMVDMLRVGMFCMSRASQEQIKAAIFKFVSGVFLRKSSRKNKRKRLKRRIYKGKRRLR